MPPMHAPTPPEIDAVIRQLATRGCARWPALLPEPTRQAVAEAADAAFADARRLVGAEDALPKTLPGGVRYVPTADSLSLHALPVAEEIWSVAEAALAPVFAAEWRDRPRRLVGHCWLRRQHPPTCPQPPAVPHGWHQDGGLGFDYLGGDPQDGLLPMLTAWIPLVPCGRDAPGLRLDARRRGALIPLDRLAIEGEAAEVEIPALAAGEALLMHGGTLHATASLGHRPRVSVELRWLPAGLGARV